MLTRARQKQTGISADGRMLRLDSSHFAVLRNGIEIALDRFGIHGFTLASRLHRDCLNNIHSGPSDFGQSEKPSPLSICICPAFCEAESL
jgi:hypothetical protein